MASAPGHDEGIVARVDAEGRLVTADALLADLQGEAGGVVGERLLLPQLAGIARLVRKLGITVARPALVAGKVHDVEMWVRGELDGDDVLLTVESWRRRPAQGPRLEHSTGPDDALPASRGEWSTDSQLRVTELSADLAALLGVTQPAGQALTKIVRLVENEEGTMPILLALAARAPFNGQVAVGRDAHNAKLLLSGSPIEDSDGNFAGFRGRAEPETREPPSAANEIGNPGFGLDPALDHALRSPINRIISAAEGIADRTEGPLRSDYASYADDIAAAARHLLSVIRSMVDQPPENESRVDMVALAEEAIGLVEAQAEEKDVALSREGARKLEAFGDPRAIVQILVNLLANAIRHCPNGSTVHLSLVAGTEFASATVADEGSGIAIEDQERIFERFERGETGGSSGLGLAIARRLARSMGGDITLVSAPGEGASFTLSVPLA